MSIQENTQSAGGSGEILDATNIDADEITTEIDAAKTTKQRGKGKVYSILKVYTDLDLANQQIQEGLAEGQWSVKNTTPDADGYTVWFICKHKNCPKRMKFNVNILNAN